MNAPISLGISLPTADRRMEPFTLSVPRDFPSGRTHAFNRVAFAAAHVVADPLSAQDPWLEAAVDWDATLRFRRHLWALGFGVAEAMDTAQRGMGLDWPTSLELIRRSIDAARDFPGAFLASGAGTDHLAAVPGVKVADVIAAYEQQFEAVERAGGRIIMMASRALAACTNSPDEYYHVYTKLLHQAKEPVIIHWLGEMFDPALAGYWGYADHYKAMEGRADGDSGQRPQNRRHQGLAARQAEGSRPAPAAAEERAHVHRRRLQLRRADRRRFAGLLGCAAGDLRLDRARRLGGAVGARAGRPEDVPRVLAPPCPVAPIFGAPTRSQDRGVSRRGSTAWDRFLMVGGQRAAHCAPRRFRSTARPLRDQAARRMRQRRGARPRG
jgi:hypothetical protein